jgi:flagellar biosynthesis/type III secretory pathway protein FliH
MLRQHPNPFALLTLAHLQAQQTRKNAEARVVAKIDLLKLLYGRGLDAEQMRQWYRYLDWLMPLSAELERQVWQEVARSREEQKMPFVTFAERNGYEKGEADGLQKGLQQGREEGKKETLFPAIETILELKFGAAAAPLLTALREQPNLEVLEKVFHSIKTGATLEELGRLLPGSTST